jgi:collagen type IV alpha
MSGGGGGAGGGNAPGISLLGDVVMAGFSAAPFLHPTVQEAGAGAGGHAPAGAPGGGGSGGGPLRKRQREEDPPGPAAGAGLRSRGPASSGGSRGEEPAPSAPQAPALAPPWVPMHALGLPDRAGMPLAPLQGGWPRADTPAPGFPTPIPLFHPGMLMPTPFYLCRACGLCVPTAQMLALHEQMVHAPPEAAGASGGGGQAGAAPPPHVPEAGQTPKEPGAGGSVGGPPPTTGSTAAPSGEATESVQLDATAAAAPPLSPSRVFKCR